MTISDFTAFLAEKKRQDQMPSGLIVIAKEELFEPIQETLQQKLAISIFDCSIIAPLEDKQSIGIKEVQQWARPLNLAARQEGSGRLAIIQQADLLTTEAANALLKLLEEPPKHLFLLLLAQRDAFLPTIRSRLSVVRVASLPSEIVATVSGVVLPNNLSDSMKMAEKLSTLPLSEALDELIAALRPKLAAGPGATALAARLLAARLDDSRSRNRRLVLEDILINYVN